MDKSISESAQLEYITTLSQTFTAENMYLAISRNKLKISSHCISDIHKWGREMLDFLAVVMNSG
jgi:predicted GNAT family acetyltransferase